MARTYKRDKIGRFASTGSSSSRGKSLRQEGGGANPTRKMLTGDRVYRDVRGKATRVKDSVGGTRRQSQSQSARMIRGAAGTTRSGNRRTADINTVGKAISGASSRGKSLRQSVKAKSGVAATTRANLGGVSDNGASGGWGSGLVKGKKSDLGLRKQSDGAFGKKIRATNRARVQADTKAIASSTRRRGKKK